MWEWSQSVAVVDPHGRTTFLTVTTSHWLAQHWIDDSMPRTWHHTYVIASVSTRDKAIISSDASALVCSSITPCYDKPSLKVGELSGMYQPLAQGRDKSRQTTQSHWRVLQAYVLYTRTKRGFTERSRSGSKRTSWIVRATILGFIYTLDVLLSKLSRSVSSK